MNNNKEMVLLPNGITTLQAKQIIRELLDHGGDVNEILKREEMGKISIENLMISIDKVLKENKPAIQDYILGKENALNFLVGQVIKDTNGRAEPSEVHILIRKILEDEIGKQKYAH